MKPEGIAFWSWIEVVADLPLEHLGRTSRVDMAAPCCTYRAMFWWGKVGAKLMGKVKMAPIEHDFKSPAAGFLEPWDNANLNISELQLGPKSQAFL